MKTFEIRGGDLVLGPGGFGVVSGATKVKQDLAVAVREPLGCDRFHPGWGTTLADFVGGSGDPMIEGLITSEVTRLVRNYVATQGENVRHDRLGASKPRLGTDELVSDIGDIQIRQEFDRLYLRVTVRTASGQTVALTSAMGV